MADPATWRMLLGSGATDAQVQAAIQAWQVLPPRLEWDFPRQCISRIELSEADGTAAVTFAPEAARLFAAENA
jgi:hypothetical protein